MNGCVTDLRAVNLQVDATVAYPLDMATQVWLVLTREKHCVFKFEVQAR